MMPNNFELESETIINRTNKFISGSKTPEVGPFWIYRKHILCHPIKVSDQKSIMTNETNDHEITHIDCWQNWRRNGIPVAIKYKWNKLLRGRVFCKIKDDTFVIMTDVARFTDNHFRMVASEFHLPTEKTIIVHNSHYEKGWEPNE